MGVDTSPQRNTKGWIYINTHTYTLSDVHSQCYVCMQKREHQGTGPDVGAAIWHRARLSAAVRAALLRIRCVCAVPFLPFSLSLLNHHFFSWNKPPLKRGKGGRHFLTRETQKGYCWYCFSCVLFIGYGVLFIIIFFLLSFIAFFSFLTFSFLCLFLRSASSVCIRRRRSSMCTSSRPCHAPTLFKSAIGRVRHTLARTHTMQKSLYVFRGAVKLCATTPTFVLAHITCTQYITFKQYVHEQPAMSRADIVQVRHRQGTTHARTHNAKRACVICVVCNMFEAQSSNAYCAQPAMSRRYLYSLT